MKIYKNSFDVWLTVVTVLLLSSVTWFSTYNVLCSLAGALFGFCASLIYVITTDECSDIYKHHVNKYEDCVKEYEKKCREYDRKINNLW